MDSNVWSVIVLCEVISAGVVRAWVEEHSFYGHVVCYEATPEQKQNLQRARRDMPVPAWHNSWANRFIPR
jgi:hypothetical protein